MDSLSTKAIEWIELHILRPDNLLHFMRYLMLETASRFPKLIGNEKKSLVLGVIHDLLNDETNMTYIRSPDKIKLASTTILDRLIDLGIDANKKKFQFLISDPDAPSIANEEIIKQIADVANDWFKGKNITTSTVITGIVSIMETTSRFFAGDGYTKKDIVLRVVKEIVDRETKNMNESDRNALNLLIDSFGASIVDYLVDMTTGEFDFKGLIQKIKSCCLPCSQSSK